MSGERALQYARTRHADSDFGRNQRQQQVLMAIFNRIREQGLLNQLTSVNEYTSAMRDYIRTDLSHNDMLTIAQGASTLDQDSIIASHTTVVILLLGALEGRYPSKASFVQWGARPNNLQLSY